MGGWIALAGLTEAIIDFFDRHLTQEDVRRFLVSEYQAILEEQPATENLHSNLTRVGTLLAKLGWIDVENQQYLEEMESITHVNATELWVERLNGGHVVSQGLVMIGAGENLDNLDSRSSQEDFVRSEAERLLRHVENRRNKSLGHFSENLDKQQKFKEKTDLAIFFSRYALRHNDLRFLNVAFKLNEWLMVVCRKVQDSQLRIAFLLALAEQEISAQELLK